MLPLGSVAVIFFFLGFLNVAAAISVESVYKVSAQSQVLGESEENESKESDEAQKNQEEAQKEAVKKEQEQQKEKRENENSTQRINTQANETEIETSNGLKVKTKIEDDGRRKLEIEQKKFKFKMETRKPQVKTEIESEDLEDDEDLLTVATDSGRPSLTRRSIQASSDFPLSIDPTTQTLTVTTPQGTKSVTVLPDQAVENLLRVGLISTNSANLSSVSSEIQLTEKDGKTVYIVQAKKKFKLFGAVDLETPTTVTVSAEDGQIISQERSFLTDIIDFLSP